MVHVFEDIVRHREQGDLVRRSEHESEHVHIHRHAGGSDGKATAEQLLRAEVGRNVSHSLHVHKHVAIGDHHLADGVNVVAHHADGSVTVDPVTIPEGVVGLDFFAGPFNWLAGLQVVRADPGEGEQGCRKKRKEFHEII